MKLTESQLRKIIREELEAVREAKTPTAAELAEKDDYYYPPGGKITDLAINLANARGLKIADRATQLKYFKKARELAGAPAGPVDEEKTDPIPLRTIFLDGEVNAAIDAGRSSRTTRGIPDPTPQIIRTRLNAMLGQKAGEGIASYQGEDGSPKRKLMIRTAIRAYENEYTRRKRR